MDALGLAGCSEQGFRETHLVTKPSRSDSQAENAGSIPVTRSTESPRQRWYGRALRVRHLDLLHRTMRIEEQYQESPTVQFRFMLDSVTPVGG